MLATGSKVAAEGSEAVDEGEEAVARLEFLPPLNFGFKGLFGRGVVRVIGIAF